MSLLVSLKKILKNPVTVVLFVIYFAIICCKLYHICFELLAVDNPLMFSGIIISVQNSAEYLTYIFVFFLFVSYEACRDIGKSGISETLQGCNNAKIKLYFSHIAVLSVFVLVSFLLHYTFNMASLAKISSGFQISLPEYKLYILKFCLVYELLVPLCAVCIGTLFSAVFKRIGAYIAMLVTVLLVLSSQVEGILAVIAIAFSDKVFNISDLFSILPDGLNRRAFFWSAFSVGEYKCIRACILICISLFLLILYVQKRKFSLKNTLLKSVCAVVCILFIFEYCVPKSQLILENDHPQSSTFADAVNCGNDENLPADFKVLSYKMNLEIDKELSAEVEMKIDNGKAGKMFFTLWNGFNLNSVEDKNGNALSYLRDVNYLSVTNTENNDTFVFKYKGHSNRFMSNSDITYLAGYFPYYPMAGKCRIMNPLRSFAFNDNSYDYDVQFDVTVSSKNKVISNLERVGENKFSGRANSACVFSGFIDEMTIDGVKFIYPYTYDITMFRSSSTQSELENYKYYSKTRQAVGNLLRLGFVKKGGTVVLAPALNQQPGERNFVAGDTTYITNIIVLFKESDERIIEQFEDKVMIYAENN